MAPIRTFHKAGWGALAFALLAAGALAAEGDALKESDASRLRPYASCDGFAGGVRATIADRRPADAPRWREVVVDGEVRRVSVLDGYRVFYSYPRTYPFARLNAERSDPARYDEDKRVVREQFAAIARADGDVELASFAAGGFSGQTLAKKALGGRALGITHIFADADATIVTIFFLNQEPEVRSFRTHEEFVALRERFVRGYLECVETRRAARRP